MTTFDKLSNLQKARVALHRDTRAISSETCHFLGLEITKQAMDVVAELIYNKLSVYATDLEAFSKHAKRTTINGDDVKLLVRRNPNLLAHLNATAPSNSVAPRRRKTGVKPQETPSKNPEDAKTKENSVNKASEVKDLEKNKETVVDDKLEELFAEDMIVDDTIDLTFD